ncbi:DUF7546 family protein [Halobaculum lipolyticum]|uniref:Uncharacterized protein n=1 Tax=Halobaculum lipolyticum TaxID=3032001 RepID=A0ABD5W761_9EURY|nr:hypothetical protein [Halobaculum sp. DT31]
MTRFATRFRVGAPAAVLRTAVLALGAQSALALAYLATTEAGVASPRTMAVPVVWVTAAVVGVCHAERPESAADVRAVAAVVGVAYGVGLAWVTGAVAPPAGAAGGLDVLLLPPWWGPLVRYDGASVSVFLFPYRAVGYAALAYLVSLAVRDVAASGRSAAVGGLVALGSCAGCALPLVAGVASVLGGAGVGVGAAVAGETYLFATVAYVLSVAVLTARPTIE